MRFTARAIADVRARLDAVCAVAINDDDVTDALKSRVNRVRGWMGPEIWRLTTVMVMDRVATFSRRQGIMRGPL